MIYQSLVTSFPIEFALLPFRVDTGRLLIIKLLVKSSDAKNVDRRSWEIMGLFEAAMEK